MSYAKMGTAIARIEDYFDRASASTLGFAEELNCLPEAFREKFFEVALNFIQATADRPRREMQSANMVTYWEMAQRIRNAIPSPE